MRFIVFERTPGHCYVTLLQATSMTQALGKFLAKQWNCLVDGRGMVIEDSGLVHPLALIEKQYKATEHFDELEIDPENFATMNQHSFEVRVLPESAVDADIASVFVSAEPGYTAGEIVNARIAFMRDYPEVDDARAFFWCVREGVLVNFFVLLETDDGPQMEVVARYLSSSLNPWNAIEWEGSYEDISEMMTN